MPVSDVGLLGEHNLQNVCAAVAATWELTGANTSAMATAISGFTGLPHHLEHVATVAGVRFYDDSFSTVPDATIAALAAVSGPKLLIVGGSDKNADFHALARALSADDVRQVFLIGQTAPQMAKAFDDVNRLNYELTAWRGMPELVQRVHANAQPGDSVLLSPGCASFGLFGDYKQRGTEFQHAVLALDGAVPSPAAPAQRFSVRWRPAPPS